MSKSVTEKPAVEKPAVAAAVKSDSDVKFDSDPDSKPKTKLKSNSESESTPTDSVDVLVNFLNIVGAIVYSKLFTVERDEDGDFSIPPHLLYRCDYIKAGLRRLFGKFFYFDEDHASTSDSPGPPGPSEAAVPGTDNKIKSNRFLDDFPDLANLPTALEGLCGYSIINISSTDTDESEPEVISKETKRIILIPGTKAQA